MRTVPTEGIQFQFVTRHIVLIIMVRVIPFVCLLAICCVSATADSKISPSLLQTLRNKSHINILVSMRETPEVILNEVSTQFVGATRAQRSQAVYDALTALAERSQANVLSMLRLRAMGGSEVEVKSFWVTNQIYIRGADRNLIQALTVMDDVRFITEDRAFQVIDPIQRPAPIHLDSETFAEWGVEKILAPQAIEALGTNGTGVVVGILDTGVQPTHQDLKANFKGGNHAWYNPYHLNAEPFDVHGHGTHCAGIAVGRGGIGVAPGASWIACKGIDDSGTATLGYLISCGQFFACPHDYLGNNHNCSLAPDVVSNSWGVPFMEDRTWYDDVLRAYHAVGIIPVFAAGNEFEIMGCEFVRSPADSVVDVISVGATTEDDSIAVFSSRGPGTSGNQVPHISAPGFNIRSASAASDTGYIIMSGTSMATPNAAGLAALLRAANPLVSSSRVKSILQSTADRDLTFDGENCGGVSDNVFPNYKFGYGRINALRAALALRTDNM